MDEKPSQFDKADFAVARLIDVFMTRTESDVWEIGACLCNVHPRAFAADTVSPDDQAAG